VHGTACQFAFRYQYNTAILGFTESVLDKFFQLVDFRAELRNNGWFGSPSKGAGW